MESWSSTVKTEDGERSESYAHAKEPVRLHRGSITSHDATHARSDQPCGIRATGRSGLIVKPPTESDQPRGAFDLFWVSSANQRSMRLSHDALVGVKWT
jgi:hypothetical protein